MRCEQARQLFDAYLDGELSATQSTELGAHRLQCGDCRRALALLEVSGHIVASDRDPVSLRSDFVDRLLACMEAGPARWPYRIRRGLYIAGPVAAAAVIGLAFMGFFDSVNKTQVAGHKEVRDGLVIDDTLDSLLIESAEAPGKHAGNRSSGDPFSSGGEENRPVLQQGGHFLDQLPRTILQSLETLREAQKRVSENVETPAAGGTPKLRNEVGENVETPAAGGTPKHRNEEKER